MTMLNFQQALGAVKEKLEAVLLCPSTEVLPLDRVRGRVLAEDVNADRDYPPFHRATRDGFAVRSSDLVLLPVTLERMGELRAGEHFPGRLGQGQCLEIMTGAPLPEGADAVVMIEHVRVNDSTVEVARAIGPFENVVKQGSEAPGGARVLARGRRLRAAEMGLLASVGRAQVKVFSEPRVAILPTGDEVVPVEQTPEWFQIRNSNAVTLAAQVAEAGGVPRMVGTAPDQKELLRKLIEDGLTADILLMSGGISMGKYDLVAEVLKDLGAEIYFQGVAIRPGKPLTFGRVREKFFFALPGNPVSTFVTFELFVRPAIALMGGADFEFPAFLRARLGKPYQQKSGLTAFMPARVATAAGEPVVTLVGWQGSGDLVGVSAANCFLVVHPDQNELKAGDWVDVLWRSH
ncbi:MAG TPA: gephyrin-like molybdotransferase Glp [Terriglobia bacterium]|nr:gephyrin-like molybdotransferase Glp [Terriglobia bacterium]